MKRAAVSLALSALIAGGLTACNPGCAQAAVYTKGGGGGAGGGHASAPHVAEPAPARGAPYIPFIGAHGATSQCKESK